MEMFKTFNDDVEHLRIDPKSSVPLPPLVMQWVSALRQLLPGALRDIPYVLVSGPSPTGSAFNFASDLNQKTPTPRVDLDQITEVKVVSGHTDAGNTATPVTSSLKSSDVFGSPLKMVFIANLSLNDSVSTSTPHNHMTTVLTSVPIKTTRRILANFCKKGFEPPGPSEADMVIIICYDKDDPTKPIIQGIYKSVNSKQRKEITTLNITMSQSKLKLNSKCLHTNNKDCNLNVRYSLMEQSDDMGWISLDAKWMDREGRMSLTDITRAMFTLNLHVNAGNEHSPVFTRFCELQKVAGFLRATITLDLSEVTASDRSGPAAVDVIQEFIKNNKTGSLAISQGSEASAQLSSKQLSLNPRPDLDFTDHLWQVLLKYCEDIDDLKHCLFLIFAALKSKELRAHVSRDNSTVIASLVRQAHSGNAVFPTLSDTMAIRLTAECGIMKVKKDLMAIFQVNRFCTAGQWEDFFKTKTAGQENQQSSDMEELIYQELKQTFKVLSKLHHCLEVVSVVDAFTDGMSPREIAQEVLVAMRKGTWDEDSALSYPVTAQAAMPELRKHFPTVVIREAPVSGTVNTEVDCLMAELPPSMNMFSEQSLQREDSRGSIDSRESLEDYHHFKTFARTLLL